MQPKTSLKQEPCFHLLTQANDEEQCQQAKKRKRFTSEAPHHRGVRVREDSGWK